MVEQPKLGETLMEQGQPRCVGQRAYIAGIVRFGWVGEISSFRMIRDTYRRGQSRLSNVGPRHGRQAGCSKNGEHRDHS